MLEKLCKLKKSGTNNADVKVMYIANEWYVGSDWERGIIIVKNDATTSSQTGKAFTIQLDEIQIVKNKSSNKTITSLVALELYDNKGALVTTLMPNVAYTYTWTESMIYFVKP